VTTTVPAAPAFVQQPHPLKVPRNPRLLSLFTFFDTFRAMTRKPMPESWRTWLLLRAETVRYHKTLRLLIPLAKLVTRYRGVFRPHLLELEYLLVGTHRTNVVANAPDGARYVMTTTDQGLSRSVYAWGSYERGQLLRAVERAHVSPDSIMLDLGSNIGTAAISGVVSGWFAGAVCVEAEPETARLMRTNIVLNGLDARMTGLWGAVGAGTGELRFHVDPERRGMSRVTADGEIVVPVRPVTDILDELHIDPARVGLVWVDVEGQECAVIEGAGDLWNSAPWVLEMRSVLGDLASLAMKFRDREVLVLTENDLPSNRTLSVKEIDDIINHRVTEICLDVLVLPKSA